MAPPPILRSCGAMRVPETAHWLVLVVVARLAQNLGVIDVPVKEAACHGNPRVIA